MRAATGDVGAWLHTASAGARVIAVLPTSPCRSCGSLVVWAMTDSGRWMPVDRLPDERGTLRLWTDAYNNLHVQHDALAPRRHRPHFATCPDAESWRKR